MIVGTQVRSKIHSLIKGFWSSTPKPRESLNPKPTFQATALEMMAFALSQSGDVPEAPA